jgi:copper chaperone
MAEAAAHTYKFNVSMSCGGCSGAVDRVLKKLDGMRISPVNFGARI